jgi:surfeit locus 1 family protein
MRIHFRPLIGLSIATAILFSGLIGLGVWQLERLQWKLALIASVNRNLAAPPISLEQALALGANDAQYRRVTLAGRFENQKETFVYSTDIDGRPAYHVIVPFRSDAGTLLVDRGIVPPALQYASTRKAGEIDGRTRITGVWRVPDRAGPFTPPSDLAHRIWYSREVKAIARADGVALAAPVILEADSTPNPGGWPRGGQTRLHFRNEHLQYAITWFALAASLLVLFFAYHRARGRLKFDPDAAQ